MNAYALIIYGRPIESFLGLIANVLRVDPFYRAVVHLDISINYADYKGTTCSLLHSGLLSHLFASFSTNINYLKSFHILPHPAR